MDAIRSSDTPGNLYQAVRCHIPEDSTLQSVFVAKSKGLMLFSEIIDIYSENQVYTLQGQNENILILNQVAHIVNSIR
jgi:hypothetical protein